jgi:predicted nucleic acid-binding protein
MTPPSALIDTSILEYLFDAGDPKKRRISRDLLACCWQSEFRYAISVQNIEEFIVLVSEQVENPMPPEVVQRFIRDIVEFDGWTVLNVTGATILRALGILRHHHIRFRDALIVATMQENGISTVITADPRLTDIPGIIAVNPYP